MSVSRARYAFNETNQVYLRDRLFSAVRNGDIAKARQCMAKGANINARNVQGDTPLLAALKQGDTGMALMLVVARASLDVQDVLGKTPLFIASERNMTEAARGLIDAGADVTIEDSQGRKALDMAIATQNVALVELFEKPLRDILSRIPSADLARALRASNSSLDALDAGGHTGLTRSAAEGWRNVAEAFLDAGADPDVQNREGKKPVEVAREHKRTEMAELFEQAKQRRSPAAVVETEAAASSKKAQPSPAV